MKNVLFTHAYENDGTDKNKRLLESLGYNVFYEKESTFEYRPYMKDIEVLVCYNPFDRLDLDDFPSLKWIQISSMGFDQLPKEKVVNRDIIVTNNKGGYSIPIGEWIVLNILELIKNRKLAYTNQQNKNWYKDLEIMEIYNKTISFLGTGDIPGEAVKRLAGFGTRILGVNTTGRAVEGFDKCYPLSELDTVLKQSDVVVICLPETPDTKYLFDKERLSKMKEYACLINISRGSIIKEDDLIKHLEEGYLKGVALDVFEKEPLPDSSKLWDIDRVVVTAHNSWMSEMTYKRRWKMICENLRRYMNNEELINIVDIKRGY